MSILFNIPSIYSLQRVRKLKQGLGVNPEGRDGEGDGREVQKGGDMCIPMADSC